MEAVSPVSVKLALADVPILTNAVHPAPLQRKIEYPVTPTLSVDAVQVSPICELLEAVASRLVGAVGATVSGVTAEAVFEKPLRFPAASVA